MMRYNVFLLTLFLLFPLCSINAQIDDNFEDGNIAGWTESEAGHWEASGSTPLNGAFSLHHSFDNSQSGKDQISKSLGAEFLNLDTEKIWRFQIKYAYKPSGSNKWACFLMADSSASQMFPGGTVNGYAIGVNYKEKKDTLRLWKITAGSSTSLISTGINWEKEIGKTATVGIEVKRSASGEWSVKLDKDGGFDNLQPAGATVIDLSHTTASYMGFYYAYTASADQKLWLDDVYAAGKLLDKDPPKLTSLRPVSSRQLKLVFSEKLDQNSAENTNNYEPSGTLAPPTSAILQADNKTVILNFSGNFEAEQEYTIRIKGIKDLSNNVIADITEKFTYTPLAVRQLLITSPNTIDILFNKNVEKSTAETLSNYSSGILGNPSSATLDAHQENLVHLQFSSDFILGKNYTLTVQNIKDKSGNPILAKDLEFTYYKTQHFDLVINEIMCDINPVPQALPGNKYIELFNRSAYPVNLHQWTLQIGGNAPKTFPNITLASGDYAIICAGAAASQFSSYGIPIPILTESHLTTTGRRILLKDSTQKVIDDIFYKKTWYRDEKKNGGGYSLERIDPENFCGTIQNWQVSKDVSGGTPGRKNSVQAVNPDNLAPSVKQIIYENSRTLFVLFTENLKKSLAENTDNYTLNDNVHPTSVLLDENKLDQVILIFGDHFPEGKNSLKIENITDNCDNTMSEHTETFEYKRLYPETLEIVSENQLKIHFSEKIDPASGVETSNYWVDNDLGNPQVVAITNQDSSIVLLTFAKNFVLQQPYTISIQNVKDKNDNIAPNSDLHFVYYLAQNFDIVINEIMPDVYPVPPALPAAKYVELYNRSAYTLDLTGWTFLSENQKKRTLPFVKLQPGEYLLFCEKKNEELLKPFGKTIPILSADDLFASGKQLSLCDANGRIIDEVFYTGEWFKNNQKKKGGWALERIDFNNFCGEEANWTASQNFTGGTPGTRNSVQNENLDEKAPELIDLQIISSNQLLIVFDKKINYSSALDSTHYSLNNGIEHPQRVWADTLNPGQIYLIFNQQFAEKNYTLMVEKLEDNCGNVMQTTSMEFDYKRIYPTNLWVIGKQDMKIKFSEPVDKNTAEDFHNYQCNNELGNPERVMKNSSDPSEVILHFSGEFPNGTDLRLKISGIKDLNGNICPETELSFIYFTPNEGDLVINEVLFDSNDKDGDFVEIYNRSDYPVDISRLQLGQKNEKYADSIVNISSLSDKNIYLKPKEYMAFCQSKKEVLRFYISKNETNIIEKAIYPLPQKPTTLVLLQDSLILDEFSYSEDMHFKLLDNTKGISLERISPDRPTQEASNWYSASEYAGFATPAYKNSQYKDKDAPENEPIAVSPHVFSPDNDGIDDYVQISYKFEDPGTVASVWIFDAKGRIITQLIDNKLIGIEGSLTWDGLYDSNSKLADAGTYLVLFKVFDSEKKTKVYKKTLILAKKVR